jgi:hypothetical protein
MNWDDDFPPVSFQPPSPPPNNPRRSEYERTRAAQSSSKFDPRHIKLQNKLYDSLVQQYGHDAVFYEQNFIDLKVKNRGLTTFYEIKIENTAKKCLRHGIGQLLEYTHYPNEAKAEKLIIVGDAPPNSHDVTYLSYIRNKYVLPVFYGWFNWETEALDQIV